MLQLLFLLLFASNSLATTLSQDVIASEQGFIVELYSSFTKADVEDNDSVAVSSASLSYCSYIHLKTPKHPYLQHQRQFDTYSSRAPPASQI